MAQEKILIVDDDPAVCKVISKVVSSNGLIPVVVSSGERALEQMRTEHYDLVVLDLMMGGMDGFEVVERIRAARQEVPVIILSGNNEGYNKLYGLEIGADDYVTKPFDPIFLGAKIKALIRRDKKIRQTPVISAGDLAYHPSTMKLYCRGEEIALSGKEHALLRLLMENRGRVFSKEQLYEQIWGEAVVDENAVMVYISRLRNKLERDPKNPEYILTVWGTGYRFVSEK